MPSNTVEKAQSTSFTELADRLQRLEDADAIRTLFLTYGANRGAKNWVPYADLFTEDGKFIAPIGVANGPEAIPILFDGRLREVPTGTHRITNLVVDVTGDRARARALWPYIAKDDAGMPTLTQNGIYESRLTCRDGRLRFAHHEIMRTTGVAPNQS